MQWADASGFGEAILLDGKPMVVPQSDCDRLAAAGAEIAYLLNHEMPDGSVRTVFATSLAFAASGLPNCDSFTIWANGNERVGIWGRLT